MTDFAFDLPIATKSEANQRDHWHVKARRTKAHRNAARLAAYAFGSKHKLVFPLIVTLVRVSPRFLDDDNLRGAMKAVRDGIADWLCVDDRKSDVVEYRYGQEKGKPKGVRVRVQTREAVAATG